MSATFVGRRGVKALERVVGGAAIRVLGAGAGAGATDDPRSGRDDVRRVLVSKWGHLGDTVLMVPALRALRRAYPAAELETLCTPKNAAIARWAPEFGRVIEFEPVATARSPRAARALLHRLRERPYELVIDFEQWARASALLARAVRLSPGGARVGFDAAGEGRAAAFHRTVPYAEGTADDTHEVDAFLALAAAAGAAPADQDVALPWLSVDLRAADNVLRGAGADHSAGADPDARAGASRRPFVVLYPGGIEKAGVHRRWAAERFAELADRLYEARGLEAVVVGDESERALGERITRAARRAPVRVLSGRTTLPELAAVCARAALFVGNDSGPMHLAAAAGCREVVAVFGATSWRRWRPWGVGHRVVSAGLACSPCFAHGRKRWPCPAGEGACVGVVGVDAVLGALEVSPLGATTSERTGLA